jgi:cytochrome b6-f complex iron-sulfur subunit
MNQEDPPSPDLFAPVPLRFTRAVFLHRAISSLLGIGALLSGLSFLLGQRLNTPQWPQAWQLLGAPEAYTLGSVTWFAPLQLYLIRERAGFYALSAVCTHQGCPPQWEERAQAFYCPCHGSRFDRGGGPLTGPALRPLERVKLRLHADQIWADVSVRFRFEKGEWSLPGAYLTYPFERLQST